MKTAVKLFAALLGNLAWIVVITMAPQGCSKEEPKEMGSSKDGDSFEIPEHVEFVSAEDVVLQRCKMSGLHLGVDNKRELIVVIGNEYLEANGGAQITEEKRQRTFVKAFDRALTKISEHVSRKLITQDSCKTNSTHNASRQGEQWEIKSEIFSQNQIAGAFPFYVAESYDAATQVYELFVAVVQSKKLSEVMQSFNSPVGTPGRFSIDDWIENQDISLMLGARTFVDDQGERWLVSFVTDDGSISGYLRTWARDTPNVGSFFGHGPEGDGVKKIDEVPIGYLKKVYCIWQIARSCCCDVRYSFRSVRRFHMSGLGKTSESEDDEESARVGEEFKEEINIYPSFGSSFTPNNTRLRWFEMSGKNPLSGRFVSVTVGAIRVNDIEKGEREYISQRIGEHHKSMDGKK